MATDTNTPTRLRYPPGAFPWEEVRGEVRTTYIGYRLDDLEQWWVVASAEPFQEWGWGYFYGWDEDEVKVWGELFFECLCFMTQGSAELIAKEVNGRAVNLGDVIRIDRWLTGTPGAALPRRKSAQFLVDDALPRRTFGPDRSEIGKDIYVPAYCDLCLQPATRPGGNKGKGRYSIKHKPGCRSNRKSR
jgi:hypothetical protein